MKRQHNTEKDEETKKHSWGEDYLCVFSFKRKPVSLASKQELAKQLMMWVNTPESFKISQFYLSKGISHATWQDWIRSCPELKAANEYAKETLGNKRELQATLKDGIYDPAMIKPTLGHYCPIWREEQEMIANLKSESEGKGNGTINVIMQKYPESDLVPLKKDKE